MGHNKEFINLFVSLDMFVFLKKEKGWDGERKLQVEWCFVSKLRNCGHVKLLEKFPAGVSSRLDLGDP